ncbi:DUF5681 domain-containing protein [Chryseobacterium sp.]|uniref:DUF5681 domain-containing protein n=1 Tax=Chryseobacterium sp. TaxID=1871047 RepID=UPI0011C814EE|nr:DUF5681 domain-containing protein [Chryseobacterium sp.]TXF75925.1 hypothetical protein FUA25_08450 [Chryseobacterium sp.]
MRNNDGTYTKGISGNPNGRPKGSKNKKTESIRETFIDFVEKNLDRLQEDFDSLDAKDRFKYLFEMTKFFLPSLKAVEFGNILDEMSEQDFETLINKLKNEYKLN